MGESALHSLELVARKKPYNEATQIDASGKVNSALEKHKQSVWGHIATGHKTERRESSPQL